MGVYFHELKTSKILIMCSTNFDDNASSWSTEAMPENVWKARARGAIKKMMSA